MANVKITNLPAAAVVTSLNDLLPAVEDVAGTPDTVKLTYEKLFDALNLVLEDTLLFDHHVLFANGTTTTKTTVQGLFNLLSETPELTDDPNPDDRVFLWDFVDSETSWKTYDQFFRAINTLDEGALDITDTFVYYSNNDTIAYKTPLTGIFAAGVNFDPLGAVSTGDQFFALTPGAEPRMALAEDIATYVGNSGANIWSSSGNLIRRVIYTTGATSVPMGETATSTGTGSVTAKAVTATNPQGANFTTGGTSGNIFGWTSTAHHMTGVDTTYEFLIAWPETTNVRYLCGIGSNSTVNMAGSTDTPGTAFHVALLRWSTAIPDSDLVFITGNASAQTVTTLTGVSKPAGTFRLKIVTRGGGTAIDVYINGDIKATGITGTLPTTTQTMQMSGSAQTLTGAGRVANLYEMAASERY